MPRGRNARLVRLLAAAAGGALTALALPRASLWVLGWLGPVPLFAALNGAESDAEAAGLGFLGGFVFHAVVLHWIYTTCLFAKMPPAAGALALGLLSGVLGIDWALTGWAGRALSRGLPRAVRPLVWAAVWTALAFAAARWTPRLGVDLLSYTQGPNLALLQAGSWGGPGLVGFLVLLVSASLAEAWRDAQDGTPGGPAVPALSVSLALSAAVWAHGAWVLLNRRPVEGPTARVEVLQPAVDQYHKWDLAYVQEILSGFDGLEALPHGAKPALTVWPETSVPRITPRRDAAPEAARWAKTLGDEQLAGIIAGPEGGRGPANAAQLVDPDGRVSGVYEKRILVPYGEYVPFRNLIPRFVIDHWLQVLDQFGDMSAGAPDQPPLSTALGPTGVTICYEAMFPRLSRLDAKNGARVLINITNDGWYKDTWGPYQHFAVNALRAIENRVWVIRSGNTGISAVIDPYGEVVGETQLGARTRLDAEIPMTDAFPERSFYARHGDWLGWACLGLTVLLLLRLAAYRP
jgi:apolipoprotein N-acyltransferase